MAQRTAFEQLQLEIINRARLDPALEASRLGINLNEGLAAGTITNAAKQPLAGNTTLHDVAAAHSQFMINADVFSHTGSGGTTPFQRMTNAGYAFTTAGENIALTGNNNQAVTTAELHNLLFIDTGVSGRGHRTNLMNAAFSEIGIGQIVGDFNFGTTTVPNVFSSTMLTEDFGSRAKKFITGVAYNDTNNNKFYDPGEGRGNVTVTSAGAAGHTGSGITQTAGGYEFEVGSTNGNTITFSGGGLAAAVSATVSGVGTNGNVKVDLVGSNVIQSSANTTLGAGAVSLTLLGIDNLTGIGNAAANIITGNRGANLLSGGESADSLKGGGGSDTLDGGVGFDTADYSDKTSAQVVSVTLAGATPAPVKINGVVEDTIKNIENLIGGAAGDTLNGDSQNNLFRGRGGADVIDGRGGSDTADYQDKTAAQVVSVTLTGATPTLVKINGVTEDTIKNIENLIGGAAGDSLTGDGFDNVLRGLGGNDILKGNGGADKFDFILSPSAGNVDTISDFLPNTDDMRLSQAAFTGVGATLDAGEFLNSTVNAATNATQRIIYNRNTGDLFFDALGNTAGSAGPIKFATLTGSPDALSIADFIMV